MQGAKRHLLSLCAAAFAIYGYFVGGYINNPMTNASADLAIALVDDHTPAIDSYAGNTSDVAARRGHIYSGFGPGLGFMLVPCYLALKPIVAVIPSRFLERMDDRLFEGARVHSPQLYSSRARTVALLLVVLGTFWLAVPLSIASAVDLWMACRRYFPALGKPPLFGLFSAFSFGTVATAFTSNLSHTAVAAFLVWIAVCRGMRIQDGDAKGLRLVAIGFLLGFAPTVDYQASLFSLYAGLFVLWLCSPARRIKAAGLMGLGAGPPIAASLLYHFIAFGSAFTNAYRFRVRAIDTTMFSFAHLAGNLPTPLKLSIAFVGPFSGILLYHPLLICGLAVVAYFAFTDTDTRRRPFWFLALATMLTNIGIYSCFPVSVGPGSLPTFPIRYTVYSVPFELVGMAALANELHGRRRLAGWWAVALFVINAIPVWVFLFYGVPVYPSRGYWQLFREIGPGSYTLTKLHEGRLLRSPIWGWSGLAAMVPLALIWRRRARAFFGRYGGTA